MKHAYLYGIAFAEGAAVMAAEIGGAKLIAPFYGSSLYVWSAVMAVTLGGLASGYFTGGRLSRHPRKIQILQRVLMLAIAWLLLMPFMPGIFNSVASHLSLLPAVVLSVGVLLFPVMACMGATSPLIIACLTRDAERSGENSGKIYAISTCGGILATFLCGFWLIPSFGLIYTCMGFAALLFLALLLFSLHIKRLKHVGILVIPALLAGYGFTTLTRSAYTIYEADGILGKLEVRDEPSAANPSQVVRKLLVNTIVQTEMDLRSQGSVSAYSRLLEKNLPYMPTGHALVLGLGGGVVPGMLHTHGYKITAVEFDPRIIDLARRYFYMAPSVNAVADDARHYINTCKGSYALVLFDMFKAEEQPSHVITLEGLDILKTHLDSSSVVIVNTHGYLQSSAGKGTRCLLATLKKSGFFVTVCATGTDEDYRNLLIYASLKPLQNSLHEALYPLITDGSELVNTDNRQVLDVLNAEANRLWRSHYIRNYITAQ